MTIKRRFYRVYFIITLYLTLQFVMKLHTARLSVYPANDDYRDDLSRNIGFQNKAKNHFIICLQRLSYFLLTRKYKVINILY